MVIVVFIHTRHLHRAANQLNSIRLYSGSNDVDCIMSAILWSESSNYDTIPCLLWRLKTTAADGVAIFGYHGGILHGGEE